MIPALSEPSGYTFSAKCFNTVMKWISRCQKEHTLRNSTIVDKLPHRILEIQTIRPLRVRVMEGGSRIGVSKFPFSFQCPVSSQQNGSKTNESDMPPSSQPSKRRSPTASLQRRTEEQKLCASPESNRGPIDGNDGFYR